MMWHGLIQKNPPLWLSDVCLGACLYVFTEANRMNKICFDSNDDAMKTLREIRCGDKSLR